MVAVKISDKSTAADLATIKPGMVVKVHEKIKEKNAKGVEKERIQIFEGLVLMRKHGNEAGATITVRKVSDGVGVEKIYHIFAPVIDKIEIVKEFVVHRAKLGYTKTSKKKLKEKKADKKA
jgi:large subunit ribosomal protein L19